MSSHSIRTLPETSCSLVIVGAGLAGLYAARLLQGKYPSLLVLEATDQPGGRVRQVPGVAPWPVEAGPQFIHGAHSSVQELLNDIGCNVNEYDWPNNWYFGQGRRFFGADTEDADLQATHNLFAEVGQESYPDPDISAEQWLRSKEANEQMLAIADACYANDFGCSLQQLGLREMITENRRWDSGDSYLVLDRDLSCLIKHIAKDLRQSILCNCPVTKVVYDAEGAVVTAAGRQIRAQQVLVTVPITVLQREDIMFVPALPQAKQEAIQRVKMSNAIKVIMLFEQPFWPADFFDVICTDCFIPEFWVTKPPTHPSAPHANSAQAPASQQRLSAEPSASLESATDRRTNGHNANLAGSQREQGQGLEQTSEPLSSPPTQGQLRMENQPLKMQPLQQQQQALQPQEADQRQQQPLHEQAGQQQAAIPQQQHSQQQHSQQHSQQQHSQQQSEHQQQSEQQQSSQQQQPGQSQQQQRQDQLVASDVHCMVGFVAGSKAEEMSKMSQTSVIMNTLAQLDTMFGTSKQRHPATFNFVRAHVVDWSQQKHIYGAYTYPTLHAEVGDRDVLAEPLCNTVFFAGEATHPAINPCMQAAMETGQRAAKQMLALHNSEGSKL